MLKISVIVPVYNAKEDVEKCLLSIKNHYNKNHEIIIVDDFSKEETKSFLESFASKNKFIKLFRNNDNKGFIKTCNFGIQQASGDIVVLLNSDTVIPSSFFNKIEKAFKNDKKIGIACPIPSNGGHFSLGEPLGYDLEGVNKLLDKKHKTKYPRLSSCNGFCFCIRRDVINKIGLLDEAYGKGYHEEVDFCYRAVSNGFECALIDNLYILHKRHASFGTKQREELIRENNIIFNKRWKNFKYNWNEKNPTQNPVDVIREELFGKKIKVLKTIKRGNFRDVTLFGIKLFTYKKNKK